MGGGGAQGRGGWVAFSFSRYNLPTNKLYQTDLSIAGFLSRPDSCSVDFGREVPKLFFQRKKAQKIHQKLPANLAPKFGRNNSRLISAEAFS